MFSIVEPVKEMKETDTENEYLQGPNDLLAHNYLEALSNKEYTSGNNAGTQLVIKNVSPGNAVKAVSSLVQGTMSPSLSSRITQHANSKTNLDYSHSSTKGKFRIKMFIQPEGVYTISVGV